MSKEKVVRGGKAFEELDQVDREIKSTMRVLDRLMQQREKLSRELDDIEADLDVDMGRGTRGRGRAPS